MEYEAFRGLQPRPLGEIPRRDGNSRLRTYAVQCCICPDVGLRRTQGLERRGKVPR